MSTITTMVGDLEAGELDWGDEDAQIETCIGAVDDSKHNIRVAVRVRPPNHRERLGDGGDVVISVSPSDEDSNTTSGTVFVEDSPSPFAFDVAFPMNCSQLDVFEAIGVDLVQCAYHGYNASLFAYGQTASGKSFSMMGVNGTPLIGLIPRVARLLFKVIAHNSERVSHVEASYMEIYNEKLRDLLSETEKKSPNRKSSSAPQATELKVRENIQLGVHVAGLTREPVGSEDEILEAIELGTNQRTTAATLYNSESSRSHAVFEITVQSKYKNPVTGADMRSSSRLALIDLAGSERSDKLGSKGKAMKEGNNINKSLTVLGRCIRALVDVSKGKKTAVPFRESVLTWYLRDSLSGNARTTMLAACSPVESNIEETMSTLRYASSAKNIKTLAKKNEDAAQAKIRELNSELILLKKRLEQAEQDKGNGSLEASSSSRTTTVGFSPRPSTTSSPDQSLDSLAMMSDIEKQNLLFELNKQMGLLTDSSEFETTKKADKATASKRRFTSAKLVSSYPMLSCLNKDELLSHAMTVSLGSDFPFNIGRSHNKKNQAAVNEKGHDSSSSSSIEKSNHFELDGTGMKKRHCAIDEEDDDDDEEEEEGGMSLSISLLSNDAVVYVNGIALKPDNKIKLKHMDRIVLGPCRLFCIFLKRPISFEDRIHWDYDEVFTELRTHGKQLTGNGGDGEDGGNHHHISSLLSPVRRTIGDELDRVNQEQIEQANIIADEMGTNIHFECEMVVRGKTGLTSPHLSVDDFLEANEVRLLVICVVDKDVPVVESVGDMVVSAKTKRHERKSLVDAAAAATATAAAAATVNTTDENGGKKQPHKKRVTRKSLSGSIVPMQVSFTEMGGISGISKSGLHLNDGWDDDDDTHVISSSSSSFRHQSTSTLKKKIHGTSNTKKEIIFEVPLKDFDDILADLKTTHTCMDMLTGGFSEVSDDVDDEEEDNLDSHGNGGRAAGGGRGSFNPIFISNLDDDVNSNHSKKSISLLSNLIHNLDVDKRGYIDMNQMSAILDYDPDFINKVWREEMKRSKQKSGGGSEDDSNKEEDDEDDTVPLVIDKFDYVTFEKFIIKFSQHQFFKCIESYVTNRELLIELGGSIFKTKNVEVENAMKSSKLEIERAKLEAVSAIKAANERAEASIAAALRNISAAYAERDSALKALADYEDANDNRGLDSMSIGAMSESMGSFSESFGGVASDGVGSLSESMGGVADSLLGGVGSVGSMSFW